MAFSGRPLGTALSKIGIFVAIAVAFSIGLAATVYLSLRSPEVAVPDVVGQHYLNGESALEDAGLYIRKRAKRYKADTKPDTILDQSPRAGEVIKVGQTVAVVVSSEESGGSATPPEESAESASSENKNTDRASARNENRNNRNKNANNRNANKNSNNQNARSSNRNTNNRNANSNSNTNRNANNRNANVRVANSNGNRNTNTGRINNANRRAPVTSPSP